MIRDILFGDITSPSNDRDIIIGMNTDLQDVMGIGRPFVKNLIPQAALDLGSVIGFQFDEKRKLYMIICHKLGRGGWKDADKHVRFGLDYLDHLDDGNRRYSIVEIGTGRHGKKDGADYVAIRTAMATSFLDVDLFVYESPALEKVKAAHAPPLRLVSAWSMTEGDIPLQMAA